MIDLLAQAESDVDALDRALTRLAGDSYGACADCARPIPAERLAAHPTAKTCVSCTRDGAAAASVRLRPTTS